MTRNDEGLMPTLTSRALRSSTFCPAGVLSVLHALGDPRDWSCLTERQHQVLEVYRRAREQLSAGVPGVSALVSDSAVRLNAELASRGWTVRLPTFAPPDLGSASRFRRAMTPAGSGWVDEVDVRGARRPAVRLRDGYVTYGRRRGPTAVRVDTVEDDSLWLLPHAGGQLEDADLLACGVEQVRQLKASGGVPASPDPNDKNGGCLFPMVDVRHVASVGFMCGMLAGGRATTSPLGLQAADPPRNAGVLGAMVQENFLQIGPAAGERSRAARRRPPASTIDGPFLLVVERMGMVDLVALCAEDCFRDPRRKGPLVVTTDDAPPSVPSLSIAPLFLPLPGGTSSSPGEAQVLSTDRGEGFGVFV